MNVRSLDQSLRGLIEDRSEFDDEDEDENEEEGIEEIEDENHQEIHDGDHEHDQLQELQEVEIPTVDVDYLQELTTRLRVEAREELQCELETKAEAKYELERMKLVNSHTEQVERLKKEIEDLKVSVVHQDTVSTTMSQGLEVRDNIISMDRNSESQLVPLALPSNDHESRG